VVRAAPKVRTLRQEAFQAGASTEGYNKHMVDPRDVGERI
jgi:hypothetical protein